MGRITALRLGRNKKRINVFIDGSFSFAIGKEVAAGAGLQIGEGLSMDQIEELKQVDSFQSCFEAALHYLGYRPRSEAEVRQRLFRRSFTDDAVNKVIVELRERKVIDDAAFAQYWKDNRLTFSPRSRQLIKRELRQKGVATETADEIVGDLNDETSAYEAGLKKARVLVTLDYSEFRSRLSGYLRRRGFSYEVISCVLARLWQERQIASI